MLIKSCKTSILVRKYTLNKQVTFDCWEEHLCKNKKNIKMCLTCRKQR